MLQSVSPVDWDFQGAELGLTVRPPVVGSRDDQTADSQCQHTRSCLGNCHIEMLLHTINAAQEEAHAQDQKQVR
jgi:hypothetical protein